MGIRECAGEYRGDKPEELCTELSEAQLEVFGQIED